MPSSGRRPAPRSADPFSGGALLPAVERWLREQHRDAWFADITPVDVARTGLTVVRTLLMRRAVLKAEPAEAIAAVAGRHDGRRPPGRALRSWWA